MNFMERKMVDLLVDLKQNSHVTAVKAEFEAEGTRIEEAMRLKEISMQAGLDLAIKVGGCEAIKDMFEANSLGVRYLIGPMVETPYALKKFLSAVRIAFHEEERNEVQFLINIETLTSCQNFDAMLARSEIGQLGGVVIGRVDLTGSMGLSREAINDPPILELALEVAAKAKRQGLKVVVGGGVSVHALPFFRAFPAGHLDRFETRKIVFQCPGALGNSEAAFLKAVEFEILWLKNKKAYYGAIHREDDVRLEMMEQRYLKSIQAVHGREG